MTSKVDEQVFTSAMQRSRDEVEARLKTLLSAQEEGTDQLRDALRYAVLGGGKRLRPILCLWTHDNLGGKSRDACLDAACALEFLHTYSLVHDDLPCMDDDDLRRGQPSCHKKYGEGIAVLVGDALLTLCFETLASLGLRWELDSERIVQTLRVVGGAAGQGGLITGQALDLESSASGADLETVERIHRYKTAALVAASMESGAVIAGADPENRQRMHRVGELAGRAFQIVDDVLDIESTAESLGKTPGKDLEEGKLTYPAVAGIEASREQAHALIAEATRELGPPRGELPLAKLLETLVFRTR
jgi:geranylgeranyl diphosphate synthase type II